MKKAIVDIFVIGFALFSMFFGAGNVIFPPYLGLGSGHQWALGFACYFIADIGLALIALFALLRTKGADGITGHLGQIPAKILMSVIVLCIGPMLAIPRTAATTFEMSIQPLAPNFSSVLFSVLFFALIFLLCIKESAVVDIVGKILTPALMIGLLILIIKGVIDPLGPVPAGKLVENVPITGIQAGYQTMDVLAALIFGAILLKSAQNKGHTEEKDMFHVVAGAGIVAGVGLLIIYMGLTYLGVTTSDVYDLSIDRSALIISIVEMLLGHAGTIIFAIVVALACVTTAIALTSSAAGFFSELSGGRLKYSWLVIVICVFSAVMSNFGLNQIIAIAAPILDLVYPPTLLLVVLSFFDKFFRSDWVYRFGAIGALIVSLLTIIATRTGSMGFILNIPLANLGFGWVIPALVCAIIGMFMPADKNKLTV